jgi:hypothetical protein
MLTLTPADVGVSHWPGHVALLNGGDKPSSSKTSRASATPIVSHLVAVLVFEPRVLGCVIRM